MVRGESYNERRGKVAEGREAVGWAKGGAGSRRVRLVAAFSAAPVVVVHDCFLTCH